MLRAFRAFAISAVTVSSVVLGLGASPAHADPPPLCEEVWLGGQWLLPYSAGRCVNWGGGTFCQEQYANADPEAQVEFYVCAPMPVARP
ncbi:MAG: hypothetical protein JO074_04590 [Frankiales bacterium]|nr:hypothetical protein [Frankiales bacterium]